MQPQIEGETAVFIVTTLPGEWLIPCMQPQPEGATAVLIVTTLSGEWPIPCMQPQPEGATAVLIVTTLPGDCPNHACSSNEKGSTTTQNRCAVFQLRRFPCCGCRRRGWRAGCIRHLRPATRRTTLQAPGRTDEQLWSASRRPW